MWLLIAIISGLLIGSAPATATDANGYWQGTGGVLCATFSKHWDEGRSNAYAWWLMGWIAAHNKLLVETYALIPDEDAYHSAMARLDSFCRDHPAATIIDAAEDLTINELYPKRSTLKPLEDEPWTTSRKWNGATP